MTIQRLEEEGAMLSGSGQALVSQWFWESPWVVPAGCTGWAHTEALHTGKLSVQESPWPIWNSKAHAQNP